MQSIQVTETPEPQAQIEALPSWIESNTALIVDNLIRQHQEGGIMDRSIPAAKVIRDDDLRDVREVVKEIEKRLTKNAQNRHKATKAAEFKAVIAEEKELVTALTLAKKARSDATKTCDAHQLIKQLRGYVQASAFRRTQQVIEALGALQQVELTPEMLTELEQAKAEIAKAKNLEKYRQQAWL